MGLELLTTLASKSDIGEVGISFKGLESFDSRALKLIPGKIYQLSIHF